MIRRPLRPGPTGGRTGGECRGSGLGYTLPMLDHPISAISFDAGDTLIHCDPPPAAIYARVLSCYGREVRVREVEPVFSAVRSEMLLHVPPGGDRYSSCGGEMEWWGAFVQKLLRRLDHPAPWRPVVDDLYAAFASTAVWRLFPEARDTLVRLGELGMAMAVTSNWGRKLPDVLRDHGLDSLFRVITVSAREGVEKPSPEIFKATLDRLGIQARETVHVGDSPHEDYEGARQAGLVPVLVDRSGAFANDRYRRVGDLSELVDLLSSSSQRSARRMNGGP